MADITHISVQSGDGDDPQDPPKAVYVDAPQGDLLEEEPFASGRHRIERMPPGNDDKPPATLWSWTEGSA